MLARKCAWILLLTVACSSAPAPTPSSSSPPAAPVAAEVPPAPSADAEQAERIAYLVRELEAARESSHIPGLAVAVVRGDDVLLARGFGVRDLDSKDPVTADTIFAIGSSTKAMTATTLAMLVDEGKLSWDDPVAKHLPELDLHIDGKKGDVVTVRDLLSHRTGFPRMSLLWAAGTLSRGEILAFASKAKPTKPFREAFQYNNVQFMAAGEIAARVSKTSWANLIRTRIFGPLGMKTSHPNTAAATGDKRRALGYTWWKTSQRHVAENHRNLDVVGPAGSVYSNVNEMTRWLRLQVGNGVFEGKRLVSEKALAETRRKQIEVGPGVGYGLGWMIRDIDGHRVIEHGGNIDGYAAAVGFFPDDKIGFVMLSNASVSTLQGQMPQLVYDAMIGDGFRATGAEIDLGPYEGRYDTDDVGALKGKKITVKAKGNTLTLDVPGQTVFELKPPDKDGKWFFKITSEVAASFEGPADRRTMLRLHQGGFDFELPREGSRFPVVVDADKAAPLIGRYRADDESKLQIEVMIYRGHLTLHIPGELKLRLDNPGTDGRWQVRARKDFNVRFEPATGTPEALVWSRSGKDTRFVREPTKGAPPAVTLASVLALRKVAARKRALTRAGLIVATGVIGSPQTGLDGTMVLRLDGSERFRIDADFGKAGKMTTVVTKGSAWTTSDFDQPEQLEGLRQAQARAGHPLAVHGDWGDFYDTVKLAGTAERAGKVVYLVELTARGLPPATVAVDSKTGDVLEYRGAAVEAIGEIPNVIRYEDFRDVGGVRLPFRIITEEFQSGETVLQLNKVKRRQKGDASMFPSTLPR